MRSKDLEDRPILRPMPGPWGKAVHALRLSKRLTQKAVAGRAKMTATTYGKIERGGHTRTSKLRDIADVFGVPIESVLQIQTLQSRNAMGNTALIPAAQQSSHAQYRPIQNHDQATIAELSATVAELQAHVEALQGELAIIAAERERHRRRSERLSATRAGKSVRARNARKAR